jgi:peptidoglycan/LPS O-acetylase OafA/YrhL
MEDNRGISIRNIFVIFENKLKRMTLMLNDALKRENNNFDFIRLIGAISVVFGHSWAVFQTNGLQEEPIRNILGVDYSGSLAVYAFFFLSGIYITSSFEKTGNWLRFLLMRLCRIYPALIVCVLLTVFVVGPLFSPLNIQAYLNDFHTWKYLVLNSTMLKFEPQLTGLFSQNSFNRSVNASLWSLPLELKCYFFIFLLGILGLLKKKGVSLILLLCLILVYKFNPYIVLDSFKPLLFFFLGSAAYSVRNHLVIDLRICLAMIVLSMVSYFAYPGSFLDIFYITFAYSILVLGTCAVIRDLKLPGDFSYGIYIYGFLVQQITAYFLPEITVYYSMLITIPISCLLGGVSWYLIESPAINWGHKFFTTRIKNQEFIPTKISA